MEVRMPALARLPIKKSNHISCLHASFFLFHVLVLMTLIVVRHCMSPKFLGHGQISGLKIQFWGLFEDDSTPSIPPS